MAKRGVKARDGATGLVRFSMRIPAEYLEILRNTGDGDVSSQIRIILARVLGGSLSAAAPQPEIAAPQKMQTVAKKPAAQEWQDNRPLEEILAEERRERERSEKLPSRDYAPTYDMPDEAPKPERNLARKHPRQPKKPAQPVVVEQRPVLNASNVLENRRKIVSK